MKKKEILITTLSCLILFCATFGVFSGVLDNEFLGTWDDAYYVSGNDFVNSGISLRNLKLAFTESVAWNWHPITMLSHMLDVELFGLNPKYHHLTSLLFHCCNTILVYLFLLFTTKNRISALLVALIFGIHPLHVESVAWVAERKDLLSTFFILIALCIYPYYVSLARGNKRNCLYILICILYLLGLMSKQMVITFPFLLLIVDFWPLNRFEHHKFRSLLLEKVPMILLSCIFVSVTLFTHTQKRFNLSDNFSTAIYTYFHHVLSFFAPMNLSYLYSSDYRPSLFLLSFAIISLIAVLIFVVSYREKYKFLFSGFAMYIVLYLPVSGIVSIGRHLYADRYMYLPMLGLSIMVVYGITGYFKKIVFVIPLFIIVMSYVTFKYEKTWNSLPALLLNAVSVGSLCVTDNIISYVYLAKYYYNKGDIISARPYLNKILIKEAYYDNNEIKSLANVTFYEQSDYENLFFDDKFFQTLIDTYVELTRVYMLQKDYSNEMVVIKKGLTFQPGHKFLVDQKQKLNSIGYN